MEASWGEISAFKKETPRAPGPSAREGYRAKMRGEACDRGEAPTQPCRHPRLTSDCEKHISAVYKPPGLWCFVTAAQPTRMTPDPCPPSTWALHGHSGLSLGCSRWLPYLPPPVPAGPEGGSVCQAHRRPPRHDACWPEFCSEVPSQPEGRGLCASRASPGLDFISDLVT